ncbi:MAG: GtrA family protein [Propionibacteriaceae bacterium]|jgi:putative flippase GtrA|nr:GtrA family protein [Propionibacteriaceae bacterium]
MSFQQLYRQHKHSIRQLIQFGLIGGMGVFVNMAVFVSANIVGRDVFGVRDNGILLPIPGTDFNIRNYYLYQILGFLVANFFNFVLNRYWTFKSDNRAAIWREYIPFLLVGLAAQLVGFLLMTLLMNPNSPLVLPSDIFDNSTGFRTKSYWANLIVIVCVTPINFVLNKLWTFRFVRNRHGRLSEETTDAG